MDLGEVEAVILFGSQVEGAATLQSDVDICVVAPEVREAEKQAALLGQIWQRLDGSRYDLSLFEELPLYLQAAIVEHHQVLFCRDLPALNEYFYGTRRRWHSQVHRQRLTFET
jgi:predicted nucleotidyltransferase